MWSGSTSSDQTATPAAIEGAENGAERAERGPGRPLMRGGAMGLCQSDSVESG